MPTEQKSSGNEIYQIKVTLLRTVPARLAAPVWYPRISNLSDLATTCCNSPWAGPTLTFATSFLFRGQGYWPDRFRRRVWRRRSTSAKYGSINYWSVLGQRSFYTYDFGDGWEHGIVLEKGFAGRPKHGLSGRPTGGRGALPRLKIAVASEDFYSFVGGRLQNPRHPSTRRTP